MVSLDLTRTIAGATARSAPPVLIVDDDSDDVAKTSAVLAAGGYALTAEARGDAVLRLVRSKLMRLVVSEMYIPCTEGRCIVAALKQERMRLPRLRVLVYSRHAMPADIEWALDAGADAIVPKPGRGDILLREIGRLIGEAAA